MEEVEGLGRMNDVGLVVVEEVEGPPIMPTLVVGVIVARKLVALGDTGGFGKPMMNGNPNNCKK